MDKAPSDRILWTRRLRELLDEAAAEAAARPPSDKLVSAAYRVMTETHERLDVLMDRHGLYAAQWDAYLADDAAMTPAMVQLEAFHGEFFGSPAYGAVTDGGQLSREHATEIFRLHTRLGEIYAAIEIASVAGNLEQVAATQDQDSSPQRILSRLQASQDPLAWAAAAKRCERRIRNSEVPGDARTLDEIARLFADFVRQWEALGTDGLKGASMEIAKRMADLLVAVAQLIEASADIELMVCCAPGTAFYSYLAKLAAQECGSREIQNLQGWWDKHRKPR